ncbi:MAG: DUF3883 domain-containing protein [Deltaproteobacteria bacterium]|nr:DUF3883 domain-containing protein [Deltaproteobacteria bacterium]
MRFFYSVVATIVAVVPIAEGAVHVFYKTPDGTLSDRLLGRADEVTIGIATQPEARHIEVKGCVQGAGTVTITRNEMLYALNQADKFLLDVMLLGESEGVEGPYYLRNPFEAVPGWGVSSVNFEIRELLKKAEIQC